MSLWTTKLVRHFVYTCLGVEYCRERIRQLLHELRFRLRRQRHRQLREKIEEQEAFVTELEALLEDCSEDWELLFVDEATICRHPTLTAQWCLVDEVPAVPTGDDPTKVHVYGAVAPLTGRTHDQISPELGKGEFAQFLQHLLAYHPGKRRLVIYARIRIDGHQLCDRRFHVHCAQHDLVVESRTGGSLFAVPLPGQGPTVEPGHRAIVATR
jgi:hypothetical protein